MAVPRCGSALSLLMSSEPRGGAVFCQRLCNEDANDAVEIGCHLEVSPLFFRSSPQGRAATARRELEGKTDEIRLATGELCEGLQIGRDWCVRGSGTRFVCRGVRQWG
jgi:hypothetical protein